MLVWLVAGMGWANAQELVPTWEVGATHTWKIEVHEMVPSFQATGGWTTRYASIWGGVFTCTVTAPRKESCHVDGDMLWWGYQLHDRGPMNLFSLPLKGTLEIVYAKDGRIRNKRFEGLDQSFYDAAADAKATLFMDGTSAWVSENDRRNVGEVLAQEMLNRMVGPLDMALPKDGQADVPWTSTHLASFARREVGSVGGAVITYAPWQTEERGRVFRIHGKAGETPMASVAQGTSVQTQVSGYAVIGPDARPVDLEVWTSATSSAVFGGFAVRHFMATTMVPGMGPEPSEPPPIPR